jgi:hypothetical protein
MIMQNRISNRISNRINEIAARQDGRTEAQPIGDILKQLLAQYEARFPEIRVTIVETSAMAV